MIETLEARPPRVKPALIVGALAFVVIWIVSRGRSTPYDSFVLLAQAFAHGHAWINWPGPYIDALAYHGQHYVIEAPLPAVLLLPIVAIFGGANQTLLAVVLAAVAIGAAWELGERFGLEAAVNAWLCGFLLAGTDLLWCAMLGDVWFIAHVAAVCFTLLALVELRGKRRGWLVALFACAAFESRFTMVLALPIYAYWLITPERGDERAPEGWLALDASWRGRLGGFVGVLVPVAVLWVGYNFARWGLWYDIGYSAWYHQDAAGMATGSPFRLAYLPYQLSSFFVQLPTWLGAYPWLRPEFGGVALTWTSPALLLALLARAPWRWTIPLVLATLLCAAPNFVYYVNGFAQFGMRHALDFEPFVLLLMMLGVRRRGMPAWGYALIAYSMLVGFWGCWYWNAFVRR